MAPTCNLSYLFPPCTLHPAATLPHLFTTGAAQREGLLFIETSALDGSNVEEAFARVATEVCVWVGYRGGGLGGMQDGNGVSAMWRRRSHGWPVCVYVCVGVNVWVRGWIVGHAWAATLWSATVCLLGC